MSATAKAAVLPASTTAILSEDSSLFGEFSAPIGFVAFTSDSDGLSDQDDDSVGKRRE